MSETPADEKSVPPPAEVGQDPHDSSNDPGASSPGEELHARSALDGAPVEGATPSTPPIPLVPRRVIKLTESSRPAPRPTPVIESEETSLEDLSNDLTEEELKGLASSDEPGADSLGSPGPRIPAAAPVPSASSLEGTDALAPQRSPVSPRPVKSSPPGPPRPVTSHPPGKPPPPRSSDAPQEPGLAPAPSLAARPPAPSRQAAVAPRAGEPAGLSGEPAGLPPEPAGLPPETDERFEVTPADFPSAPTLVDEFEETTPVPISVDPEPPPASDENVEEVDTLEDVELTAPEPDIPPADRKPPPPRRSGAPSLPKAQKPRKKPWWETLFGDDFSRAYRPMTPSQLGREVDFIQDALKLPSGSVVLDLACGQGEICVELARRGYSVVGYDLSVYQLAMAGDNAQQAHQKINFLQGDMREMAFEQMFDAVICWDTSFGYFEEEKNIDVLRRIKSALKPGGRLLLDVLNRDFVAREAPSNHWFEGDGCVCMDDMSMDWITNRLKVKRSIILDDGRSKELQYTVRLYGLSDVGRMLHDVGFRVSAISGEVYTPGAFFGPSSRRIIITANKP